MKTLARIASALLTLSIAAASQSAMANQKPSEPGQVEESAHKGSPRHDKLTFPMKSEEFRKVIEKRLERIKTRIDRSMDKNNVPAPQRAEVAKTVDAAAKEIHGAVDKAAADGMVTLDEAKEVKSAIEKLREKMHDHLKKSPRAKATKAKAKPKST